MELKNLPFQVDVINVMKLLVLGEEDKILNCGQNLTYLLYCNIVINTSVGEIAKSERYLCIPST